MQMFLANDTHLLTRAQEKSVKNHIKEVKMYPQYPSSAEPNSQKSVFSKGRFRAGEKHL